MMAFFIKKTRFELDKIKNNLINFNKALVKLKSNASITYIN